MTMHTTEIRTLFAYDAWAMERIFEQAARVTPEQYAARSGPGNESIGQILAHMLLARHLWRARLEAGKTEVTIRPDDFPTLAAFRAGWEGECLALDRYTNA